MAKRKQVEPEISGNDVKVGSPNRKGDTVTVACKMPHGLRLRLFKMADVAVPVFGGGQKMVQEARQYGETVTINGNAVNFGMAPRCRIVAGYAFTPGVNKEFFEKWLEQNEDLDCVKNNLVFAHSTTESTVDQAKDQRKITSGLQPIDPDNLRNDPRVPHATALAGGVKIEIESADREAVEA